MRTFILFFFALFSLTSSFAVALPQAHAETVEAVPKVDGCFWDKDKKAVLIDYKIVGPPTPSENDDTSFNCYLRAFLSGNSALIVTVAVIIVVFSGIQYMLALGNSGTQAKAKQRIVSVVTGVVFLTLIRFFMGLLGTS
ncbi:hypothetical protein BH11PAT4_BH11PAT4_5950 [soil metagenome]